MSGDTSGFELREHTADVALYVWGDSPPALFLSAARGFYAALGDLKPAGPPDDGTFGIELTAPDHADLICDFLSELLFIFEVRHAELTGLGIEELSPDRLRATGRLLPIDLERSVFDCGIKAVTHYDMRILSEAGRYETTIILDL